MWCLFNVVFIRGWHLFINWKEMFLLSYLSIQITCILSIMRMYTRGRKNEIREYSRNALFIVKNFYELTWQSLIQNCYPVLECQEVCNMYQSFPYYVQRKYYRCTYFALRLVYLMRPCQGGIPCCPSEF